MEHRSVCETLVQTTMTTAVVIHRRVVPCEKLFHANCTCNKLPVANNNIVRLETRSIASDDLISLSSNLHAQPLTSEDRLALTTTLHDSLIEDLLVDYVEIIENLIFNLLEKISILPFLLKNKKTIVKVALI